MFPRRLIAILVASKFVIVNGLPQLEKLQEGLVYPQDLVSSDPPPFKSLQLQVFKIYSAFFPAKGFDIALVKRLGDEVPAERPVGYSASKIFAETDGTAVEEKDGAVDNDGNVGNDGAVEAEAAEEELAETNEVDADTVEYLISAFGKNYRLDFRRNSRLVPPGFRVVFRRYRIFSPVQLLLF